MNISKTKQFFREKVEVLMHFSQEFEVNLEFFDKLVFIIYIYVI